MARCRCLEGGACGCFAAGGDGIVVTGSGSSGAPWIISAAPRATGTLDVVDTLTLDLTLDGNGIQGDPFMLRGDVNFDENIQVLDTPSVDLTKTLGINGEIILSAEANIAASIVALDSPDIVWTRSGSGTAVDPVVLVADVACIACDASGNPGDVLTLQADGTYLPGPATTAPIGSITVGTGLSGDGSAGNPLTVDLCTYGDLEAVCTP